MSFSTDSKKIGRLLDKRVCVIPRNQRQYVWNQNNWNDLLEDLQFTVLNANRPHFIGSVVLKKETVIKRGNGVDVFSVIDGQQRITTILLLLSSIMRLFKERGEKQEHEGLKSYLITNDLSNKAYCKLEAEQYPSLDFFIRNVCDWEKDYKDLDQLIAESSTALKKDNALFDAVRFFYSKLSSKETRYIESIRDALLDTSVVEIIATSDEDAYTIFEILNARGQILEDYELIKNYIMRYYEPSDDVDKAKVRWETEIIQTLGGQVSQFIKHYVTHRYAVSGNSHNFNYNTIKDRNSKYQVIDLLDDLCRKASYYQIIADPRIGENANCSDCEYHVYSFMKSKRGVLFRPVFLSLLHRKETKEIDITVYEGLLEFIKLYFICYNLLGRLTSNKLTDTVQNAARSIEDSYSPEVLKDFVEGLVRRLPTKEEFWKLFQSIAWSNNSEFNHDPGQKKRAQIALETLEAIESGSWVIGKSSIEHLHPDSADRINANIGNLVLLEPNLNEKNADKPFEEKVGSYYDSQFKTARNVYKRYHETPNSFSIDKRARAMSERIYSKIDESKEALIKLFEEKGN